VFLAEDDTADLGYNGESGFDIRYQQTWKTARGSASKSPGPNARRALVYISDHRASRGT
jgi:hypothetical protein